MNRKLSIALGIGLLVLFLLATFVFRPIMNVHLDECVKVTGTVEVIRDNGNFDIGFKLQNDTRRYYINRGQEQGLNIDVLKSSLLGKEIELWYVDQFTLLDPKGNIRHISRVVHQGDTIFNEIVD